MSEHTTYQFEDPNTGETYDISVERRNAAPPARGQSGRSRPFGVPGGGGGSRPQRHGSGTGIIHRTVPVPIPGQTPMSQSPIADIGGDYLAIRKSTLVELISPAGQVLASYLGRPEAPMAVGDDLVDRNNAALHRDALAAHQQNQARITALTDLATRALNLLMQ